MVTITDTSTQYNDATSQAAYDLGHDAGKNAAGWVFDGNSPYQAYVNTYQMILDGDPALYNGMTYPTLGNDVDKEDLWRYVLGIEDIEVWNDRADELIDAWDQGARDGMDQEIERICGDQVRNHVLGDVIRRDGKVDAYAWPGGYTIGYLTDDGEWLCANCVNDPNNPIHFMGVADGWRIEGYQILEESEYGDVCAHCNTELCEGYMCWHCEHEKDIHDSKGCTQKASEMPIWSMRPFYGRPNVDCECAHAYGKD